MNNECVDLPESDIDIDPENVLKYIEIGLKHAGYGLVKDELYVDSDLIVAVFDRGHLS